MKKNIYQFIAFAFVVAGMVWILSSALSGGPRTAGTKTETAKGQQLSEKRVVYLYFTGRDSAFLTAEERVVYISDDPVLSAESIMKELIKGPAGELVRTIPSETVVNALYVTPDHTAFVDLSGAVYEKHPGGARTELMTVYSIVNSLVMNIPGIDTVKILISGREAATLAGHINLRSPFKANMLIIR